MQTFEIQSTALIDAPAKLVYAIIADYRHGHPHILPSQFSNLVVEAGGIGAGTRICFDMTAMGRKQTLRATINEPEPGRILVEDYEDSNRTTFLVEPVAQGKQCQVTFHTEMQQRAGIRGGIERFFTKLFLKRVYTEELKLLERVAKQRNK